ncbi:2-(1,2-epoxy-1,2-dihydrophenyl)acetyl-CoA isomerase PaaG [Notoacmeibacter sp. MSK16QG-6]|uniref:2-(1,2-epoxy-1,2-dihydrophenyl)acetyl-CoA isomerase PaaG n=1 Tax=Notoacmeibacter sp. MSK16QG-6 TaxID=2957982 RepID=UPI00209EB3D8|nr:2-(1,2-epoxy-1,2-dihydrophenyl)acetyl-CoA isomerase PaaG [Notoacmeibacter sp. MSK16QG-6]MCP1200421.1 2-(1,2-epoxy-1,2-dihydrophenyl)acetyl-CoA isomerase PaaG [Notoacmeibacter sp. MSK16QG-6]
MAEEASVLTSLDGGLLTITLNRPEKLNSFNKAQQIAFREAFEEAERNDDIRAVLLTGAGRAFCAGQDLGDRDPRKMDGPPDLSATLREGYGPTLTLIRQLEKPVICAVNGVAAGAGANIALACDIVLAAKSAKFIQAFAKLGLVPDAGGSWSLARLIGEARAKAVAMTAMPVSAEQAEQWGMIWKAIDDDRLMDEATALASQLAEGATFGLGKTKLAIQAAATNSFIEQLELEAQLQGECGRSPDYAEGVLAFMEKRPAKFTGKPA